MDVRTGDRIVIDGHAVGTKPRRGVVLERLGTRLRVRWDDGRVSMFTPGSDCRRELDADTDFPARFGAHVEIEVVERGDRCTARASLVTGHGVYEATGEARCHPDDANRPMIGEELAVGRALRELSTRLLAEARHHVVDGDAPFEHLLV